MRGSEWSAAYFATCSLRKAALGSTGVGFVWKVAQTRTQKEREEKPGKAPKTSFVLVRSCCYVKKGALGGV